MTNKLLCETLSNRIGLLAKQAVRKGGTCYTWKPSNNMVEDLKKGCCLLGSMDGKFAAKNIFL